MLIETVKNNLVNSFGVILGKKIKFNTDDFDVADMKNKYAVFYKVASPDEFYRIFNNTFKIVLEELPQGVRRFDAERRKKVLFDYRYGNLEEEKNEVSNEANRFKNIVDRILGEKNEEN